MSEEAKTTNRLIFWILGTMASIIIMLSIANINYMVNSNRDLKNQLINISQKFDIKMETISIDIANIKAQLAVRDRVATMLIDRAEDHEERLRELEKK